METLEDAEAEGCTTDVLKDRAIDVQRIQRTVRTWDRSSDAENGNEVVSTEQAVKRMEEWPKNDRRGRETEDRSSLKCPDGHIRTAR